MISKDQAEQVVEILQKPSRDELDSRKTKLAETVRRRRSSVFPAGAAALVTYLALTADLNAGFAVMIGVAAGWGFGSLMQRDL